MQRRRRLSPCTSGSSFDSSLRIRTVGCAGSGGFEHIQLIVSGLANGCVYGLIALGFLLRFVAGLIWGHEPQVLESPMAGENRAFGALVLGQDDIVVIAVTIVLTGLFYGFFDRTKLGVAMQAASQNQLAAFYMGIPVKRIHGLAWALAGAAAAVAGILFASKGSIDPNTGFSASRRSPPRSSGDSARSPERWRAG